MTVEGILQELGAQPVSAPVLHAMAKRIGKNHSLALGLWKTGDHHARILAALIDEPERVTERQMERWVRDVDGWGLCDAICGALFDRTSFARGKAVEWSAREEAFVKRAGFVLMASLAVHDKNAADTVFLEFLPIIQRESTDERHFAKKGINWALRQIGKRNRRLNREAVKTAKAIHKIDSKAARWIASDALRELTSEKVQKRLEKKNR